MSIERKVVLLMMNSIRDNPMLPICDIYHTFHCCTSESNNRPPTQRALDLFVNEISLDESVGRILHKYVRYQHIRFYVDEALLFESGFHYKGRAGKRMNS